MGITVVIFLTFALGVIFLVTDLTGKSTALKILGGSLMAIAAAFSVLVLNALRYM